MSEPVDTSREAVEALAASHETQAELWIDDGEPQHAKWHCRAALYFRALLAERDAARAMAAKISADRLAYGQRERERGAADMRERAAAEVDTWHGVEPTHEDHPQRLVWAVIKTKAEAIRAMPLPERSA